MSRYTKAFLLVVAGQTICAGFGLWMFADHLSPKPGRPPAEPILFGGIALFWIAALQAGVFYLVAARFRDSLKRERVHSSHTSLKQTQMLMRSQDGLIFGLAKLADSRDHETGDHLERITIYARLLADAARAHPKFSTTITPTFVRLISVSAALHDIGKVGIEDRILQKRGALSQEERRRMETHTQIAADCLEEIERRVGDSPLLRMAHDIAISHHERWDGTGYPRGLRGEQIPLAARIVAIVDVYDALASARVYKAALPHDECIHRLRESAGKHFDPDLTGVWLKIEAEVGRIAGRYARLAKEAPIQEGRIQEPIRPSIPEKTRPVGAPARRPGTESLTGA